MDREHYFPASLIGCFNLGQPDRRHRNRSVWVASRADETVKKSIAHKVGWNEVWPQPYSSLGAAGEELDKFWQELEGTLRDIEGGLTEIELGQFVDASWYTGTLVPYVAHLLARHPQLFDTRLNLFADTGNGQEIAKARSDLFYQFSDALTHERRAILVSSPTHLLSSDRGWLVTAGPSPGDLFVPFSPTRAIVFRGDGRTYLHGDDTVDIPKAQWSRDECELRNNAIAITAPHEVYAPTEELALHALDVMLQRSDVSDSAITLARDYALAQPAYSALMLEGAAADPALARRRVAGCEHGSPACELCIDGEWTVIDAVNRFAKTDLHPQHRHREHYEFEIYLQDRPDGGIETLSAIDAGAFCSSKCHGVYLLNEHPLHP